MSSYAARLLLAVLTPGSQFLQDWDQLLDCPSPVAEGIFLYQRQLSHGQLEIFQLENRVISKTTSPSFFRYDRTGTGPYLNNY